MGSLLRRRLLPIHRVPALVEIEDGCLDPLEEPKLTVPAQRCEQAGVREPEEIDVVVLRDAHPIDEGLDKLAAGLERKLREVGI